MNINDIIIEYKNGSSIRKLSKLFNINRNECSKFLKLNNVVLRNKSQSRKTYHLNEDYFENIDSEEKAYWLGFIAADGCIYKNKLTIELALKDKAHLQKFTKSISTNAPIRSVKRHNGQESCVIDICSMKVIQDLKN